MMFKLIWRFSNSDNSENKNNFGSKINEEINTLSMKKWFNKVEDYRVKFISREIVRKIEAFSRNIVSVSSDRFSVFLTQLYYPKDFSASLNWILTRKQICKVWYLQKKMYLEAESPTLEKNRITDNGCFTVVIKWSEISLLSLLWINSLIKPIKKIITAINLECSILV
jgi:hypothetical protein